MSLFFQTDNISYVWYGASRIRTDDFSLRKAEKELNDRQIKSPTTCT